jgi:hypothetical protein
MKYFISQGYPVIAEGQVETNIGSEIRRILLIGYNNSGGIFVINDPSVGETLEITYKEFEEFNETRFLPAKGHGVVIYPKK